MLLPSPSERSFSTTGTGLVAGDNTAGTESELRFPQVFAHLCCRPEVRGQPPLVPCDNLGPHGCSLPLFHPSAELYKHSVAVLFGCLISPSKLHTISKNVLRIKHPQEPTLVSAFHGSQGPIHSSLLLCLSSSTDGRCLFLVSSLQLQLCQPYDLVFCLVGCFQPRIARPSSSAGEAFRPQQMSDV